MSKTLYLNKTDLRILSQKLQKFEEDISIRVRSFSRAENGYTKTRSANIERRIKIELQAVLLLKNLTLNRLQNEYTKTRRNTSFKQTSSNAKRIITEIKAKI